MKIEKQIKEFERKKHICPFCGEEQNIEFIDADAWDDGHAEFRWGCLTCDENWKELYRTTLVAYLNDETDELIKYAL